jgi:hypothetical protein
MLACVDAGLSMAGDGCALAHAGVTAGNCVDVWCCWR